MKVQFFSSNRKVYDWQHPSHENQFGIVRFTMKILFLFITLFFHFIVARPKNTNSNDLLKSKLMNCSTCKSPTFHGRDFYLPFCSDGQSFPNLCEAVCSSSEIIPTKGKIIYYISTQQVQQSLNSVEKYQNFFQNRKMQVVIKFALFKSKI